MPCWKVNTNGSVRAANALVMRRAGKVVLEIALLLQGMMGMAGKIPSAQNAMWIIRNSVRDVATRPGRSGG